jgi:cellulose synthase/poly-beta-1,6-N-acetylglucosamine synthase-like glycosyltransferase
VIKSVEDMGFLLCFEESYGYGEKVFVPCYNEQNGYYEDNLELIISVDGVKTKIDISNLVEDHID